ncbi:MAG TPA: hypothetical protein VEF55_09420 [Candidatus Binatia bacterium]|nr:hypothetical protein [Candidatus Binatia bacterium]
MSTASSIAVIGERLVLLALEIKGDVNESYLLAHKALRLLLRENVCLKTVDDNRLREALWALAIPQADRASFSDGVRPPAYSSPP